MPLNVKRIARSILCPGYVPQIGQEDEVVRRHEALSEYLYVALSNRGLICAKEAKVHGYLYGYRVNGIIDVMCYDLENSIIHIYEVKSRNKCYPSDFLQAMLYAIILSKNTRGSIARKIIVHLVCKDVEIAFKLNDYPTEYFVMMIESFDKLLQDLRTRGPWCSHCLNRTSCLFNNTVTDKNKPTLHD